MPTKQSPGDQYIEQPDGHEETGEELFCLFDAARPCAPDCISYDVNGVDVDGRTTCLAVNAWKQTAVSMANMARTVQRSDPVPGSQEPPPKVGGNP